MHDLSERPRPVVFADGKWRLGGFVNAFQEILEWLRSNELPDVVRDEFPDLSQLPPYLPPQCLDPSQIGRFFGIPLQDFDWKGPDSSQTLAAILRVERMLDLAGSSSQPPANRPDFLFAKSGNVWHLRFRSGQNVESGTFADQNGLRHFWNLIQAKQRPVSSLTLSPNPGGSNGRSVKGTRQDDFYGQTFDIESFTGFREEGFGRPVKFTNNELQELVEQIDSLEKQMKFEADEEKTTLDAQERAKSSARRTELEKEVRRKIRELKTGYEALPQFGPSRRAFNRVKSDLYRARETLTDKGMKALALFLEGNISPEVPNWRYSPTVDVPWVMHVDQHQDAL